MTFETDTDRLNYLKGCGNPASLSDSNGADWPIYAIFERQYVEVQGVQMTAPTLLVRLMDMWHPDYTHTPDRYAIDASSPDWDHGADYSIVENQPGSYGLTLLILEGD